VLRCSIGVVVPSRAIAVVQVEQNRAHGKGRVRNDRILALPVEARREAGLAWPSIPGRVKRELEHIFLAATALEGKDVTILGWTGPDAALELLESHAT
jgi:inorganic pyrophosphatase